MRAVMSVGISTLAIRAAICSSIQRCLLAKAWASTCVAMVALMCATNRARAISSGGMTFSTCARRISVQPTRHARGSSSRLVRRDCLGASFPIPVRCRDSRSVCSAGRERECSRRLAHGGHGRFCFCARAISRSPVSCGSPSASASHGNKPRLTTSIDRAARALVSSTSVWKIIEPCASRRSSRRYATGSVARGAPDVVDQDP